MSHLKVFSISNGTVVAKGRLPAILKQTALDAYNNASGVVGRFDHARIEELIVCAKKLLADSKKGVGIPHLYSADDNEAEKLNDLLCRGDWEKKKFNASWKPHLRDSENVHSAQVMAAYALLQIDAAATLYLAGDWKRAFTTLALATVATADYGFHLGFSDRSDLVIEAGYVNSKKSTRKEWPEDDSGQCGTHYPRMDSCRSQVDLTVRQGPHVYREAPSVDIREFCNCSSC
jgi:hypothetical protein